ncbi:nucleotide-sugar transporter-domain-containing protein [Mycena floridula]|nr:nucleotide-sugar transporter-domain-containing protein [Mycena floridula]
MSHNLQVPAFTLSIRESSDDALNDEPLGLGNDAHGNAPNPPSLWGFPLKYISLVTLAIQNSLLTIIMHYSRVSTPPSRAYSAATAVLMNEILKGAISLVIAFIRIEIPPALQPSFSPELSPSKGPFFMRVRKLCKDIFSPDCWKLSVPAILYVIQNNLQFVAVSNLEAATFQVTYQMKILTTAAFSVLLLRKKLNPIQWLSLLFLAIGVGIVQIQSGRASHSVSSADEHSMDALKGFLAVAAACFTSGLAGVYFEMVLKNSAGDLWVRNVQLSLFSLLPALTPVLFSGQRGVALGSPAWISSLFRNFGPWAWATVGIQVIGGLVTAMVIKYSDNILKGFATSLSIVISFLASMALFDFHMTFTFVLGSAIVLNATWLYNHQPKRLSLVLEASAFARSWNEKWKQAPPRIPDNARVLGISSGSRSSSVLSLSTLSNTSNTVSPMSSDLDLPSTKFGR